MLNDRAAALSERNPETVREALAGLCARQKTLPSKLFYDEEGCRLFREITALPEYYLTRTERALLERVAPIVARDTPDNSLLVEYGASDEAKAEYLLRTYRESGEPVFAAYMPIDVAAADLAHMRARLAQSRPALFVQAIVADFMRPLPLPRVFAATPRLGFFPGSTIGNLDLDAAEQFLSQARETLGAGSRLLIGVDLRKDAAVLVPAYDDAAGVTAAFNLNLLTRLNREAEADFDLDAFAHRAVWNDQLSRIEMHLVSRKRQRVSVARREINFAAGETIHTENSYKHTPEGFISLARRAGWEPLALWTDAAELYSLHLLSARTKA